MLTLSDFGQLGIALFFIGIARVLSESGLSAALIRNKQANDLDFSTIFIFNFIISIALVSLLIFSSGYIATFYNDAELKVILTFASFSLIINAFSFVQTTKMLREMRFKQKAIYDFTSIFFASFVAIFLATKNYGVWSLIIMQILTGLINVILLWTFEGRIKLLRFSKSSFLFHYKFGANTTFASLLNSFFGNINQAILGKYFSIGQTGLYYQASKLSETPFTMINAINSGVIYSGLSKIQDNKDQFTRAYLNIIRIMTVLTGFLSMMLFVFAKEIVLILLGEKWIDSVFFLQILSVIGFFNMQEMFVRSLFKIFNETTYILKLEMLKKAIHSVSILAALWFLRLDILLYGFLLTSISAAIVNYCVSRRVYAFIGYADLIDFLKTFLLIILIFLLMQLVSSNDYIQINLIFRIVAAGFFYFIGLFGLRLFNINDLKIIGAFK